MEDLSQVVDKSRPEPVYRQIADWISYKITVGDWPVDLRLPSEPDLAKAMGVSRSSLRKAMALLTSQRLLLQIQGKGTFVRSRMLEGAIDQRLRSVGEFFDAGHIPYSTTVLEQKLVFPPPSLCKSLSVAPDQKVLHVKWLVLLEGTPFLLSDIHATCRYIERLEHMDLAVQSLYKTLEQVCGVTIARSRDVFAAVASPPDVSKLLEVEPRFPALHIERKLYDRSDALVLCAESWSRSDRMRLSLESKG